MIAWPAKDPADISDFTWSPDLDAGDTIASFVATVTSGTIAKAEPDSYTNTTATVWIEGGADKELALLSLVVTTTGGRTFREGAVLPVFDRASETLAIFRLRYPAFASVSDGAISYRLYEALSAVGDNWPTEMQIPARTAWAAHKLAEAGSLAGTIPQGLTQFKSGTFSATVASELASLTGFDATVYGREFVAMRRAAFSGPIMAWNPPEPDNA